MASRKRITGRDIIEAIRQNGYEHIRGEWFWNRDKRGRFSPITKACVMGQAAINLGVSTQALESAFYKPVTQMISLNDRTNLSYEELVVRAEEVFKPYLDTPADVLVKKYSAIRKEQNV